MGVEKLVSNLIFKEKKRKKLTYLIELLEIPNFFFEFSMKSDGIFLRIWRGRHHVFGEEEKKINSVLYCKNRGPLIYLKKITNKLIRNF